MTALEHFILIALLGIISILSDFYAASRIVKPRYGKRGVRLYMCLHVLLLTVLAGVAVCAVHGSIRAHLSALMWVVYAYFLAYLPKLFYALISWVDYLRKPRGKVGNYIGLAAGMICLAALIGAAINRTRIEVKEITLSSDRLPKGFDNYRIVQFSDLHLETLSSEKYAARIIATINGLRPDIIFFTGDLVNRLATEINPYKAALAQLKACDGIYSVMGNHDYGDYARWNNETEHQDNIAMLHSLERELGWTMLNNASEYIRHGNDSIALIGVENWGEPPFPQYGDLKEAYKDLNDDTYKILLSHNPRHWRAEVLPESNIDLTLSGHTHAVQLEIAEKSPAVFRYPEWSGLYQEGEQYLYVNIGIGCVMLPARVGATPEITLITLHSTR